MYYPISISGHQIGTDEGLTDHLNEANRLLIRACHSPHQYLYRWGEWQAGDGRLIVVGQGEPLAGRSPKESITPSASGVISTW